MATTLTQTTLDITRLALYQLRQDTGVPSSVAAAESDTSVLWSKCRVYFDLAFQEVLKAHNWTWKRTAATSNSVLDRADDWPEDAKNALVYCLARELSVPVAGRVEDMKNCHQLYQQKLQQARVHDLDGEIAGVTDFDVKEVLATVCPSVMSNDNALPMDLLSLTRRIDAVKDAARETVMSAHNWSFARDEYQTGGCDCDMHTQPYCFSTPVPPKCARVLKCRGTDGGVIDWKLDGTLIRSREPVEMISYIRNIENLDKWPATVRAAYDALLSARVSATVSSAGETQRLLQEYEHTLETAKLADSRATGAKKEVYGRNYYADAMRGMRSDDGQRHWRGGDPWRW